MAVGAVVGDLLVGRCPKPLRPNDFEALQIRTAIDLQAARLGGDIPRKQFLNDLHRRLAARVGHFFPETLLASQLTALEPPGPDERVIRVVPADTPDGTVAAIIAILWPEGPPSRAPGDGAGGDHEAQA